MTLRDHVGVVWRRRWIVLLLSVVVAGAVYVAVASRDDVYEADAILAVDLQARAGALGEDDAQFLGQNFAGLATTDPVLEQAGRTAGLGLDAGAVRDRVSVDSDQGFLRLLVEGPSAADAEALAGGLTSAIVDAVAFQQVSVAEDRVGPLEADIADVVEQLATLPADSTLRAPLETRYDRLLDALTEAELEAGRGLRVVSPARAGEEPVAPRPLSASVLALLVALVVNAELAVAVAALQGRFASADLGEEVAGVTGLPVLARLPRGDDAAALDAVRLLRTGLLLMRPRPRSIAVLAADAASASAAVGLAASLARVTAAADTPAILVDADLSGPRLHRTLGVPRSPGLTEVLGGSHWTSALRMLEDRLGLLSAGAAAEDGGGLLLGGTYREVVEALSSEAVVVVHGANGDVPAEGLAAAAVCEATVVLVDAARTERRAARELVESLRRVGARPVGVVIDGDEGGRRRRRSSPSSPGDEPGRTTLASRPPHATGGVGPPPPLGLSGGDRSPVE